MAVRQLTPLRIVSTPVVGKGPNDRASVEIYRPFFLAGILSVLTAGCTLGAIALLGIAIKGSYTASVWTPYVLAHANSQLYGWVGFFVMGFALQHHPPTVAKKALFQRMAMASLGLMAVGIALRFAVEPLVAVDRAVWLPIGVVSCALQTVAVLLFVANTTITRHKTGAPLDWQGWIVLASLGWLIVAAVAEPIYFALGHQADEMASIQFVAQYFPPYREAQFMGFVSLMIFGVALVKMNSCFGAAPARKWLGIASFAGWNVGLLARMAGWVVFYQNGLEPGAGRLYFGGGLLLALSAIGFVSALRIFEPLSNRIPAHKFVRTAFLWLVVGGFLLVAEPFHLKVTGQPFSHAYIGAVRHALTVGFISQMILGVGMHVVHRMRDIEPTNELWTAFWLLNIGNALRVGLEIATDYGHGAFMPMGFTGFIELTGLAIWAYHVARPLLARRVAA